MTEEGIKKRILFVDDEPYVLQGLKRLLRPQRHLWKMTFCGSGADALDEMKETTFDIIISDMRMPNIDGIQLLDRVKTLYPGVVRFILSGHADKEMIIRSVGPAHQFLSKPCDAALLKSAISRAFALRDLLQNDQLLDIVKDASKLPTLPELYQKLTEQLNSSTSTSHDIAGIISQDISMTAKILQLVNSAFFGLPRNIDSIDQAVSLLGVETINSVVLTAGVFDTFKESQVKAFSIRDIYSHSIATGTYASRMVKSRIKDRKIAEEAMLAGMTHDFGKLVFISTGHADWEAAFKRHKEEKRPLHELEQEMLGITHAEVGAYLLGLWAFSDEIVEAVAFHHYPSKAHTRTFGTLAALHIANAFEQKYSRKDVAPQLDREYLEAIELENALDEFEGMCQPNDEE